jgi:hypothetical protein
MNKLLTCIAMVGCISSAIPAQAQVVTETAVPSGQIPLVTLPAQTSQESGLTPVQLLNEFGKSKALIGVDTELISVAPTPAQLSSVNALACPPDKAGLTDGWAAFAYSLDANAAVNLKFFAALEVSASDKFILYHFIWYKDLIDGGTGALTGKCGAGVSLVVKASNYKLGGQLTLPMLAASTQLGMAQTAYKIWTFGVSGPGVDGAIPLAARVGSFDANAYGALLTAIDKVQTAGLAADTKFVPRLVSIPNDGAVALDVRQALIEVGALKSIANGRRCSDAKGAIPDRNADSDASVERVYQSWLGAKACSGNAPPSGSEKQRASRQISAFGL